MPEKSRRSRRRSVGAAAAAVALLIVAIQVVNTIKVRNALCALVPAGAACPAATGFASVRIMWDGANPSGGFAVEPLRMYGSTALLRRTCGNAWTLAFGARAEVDAAALTSDMATLRFGRACIDAYRTRATGEVTGALLSTHGCGIRFAPFRFSAAPGVQASLGATVDPGTIAACSAMVPEPTRELAARTLANARLALDVRYGVASGGSATPARSSGTARRIFSTIPTSHHLGVTLPGGGASLRLDTTPAGDSAALTLTLHADETLSAMLPDDIRPATAGPLDLDVRWNLDHETAQVRVNGTEFRRQPVEASRAEGRVLLPRAECETAPAGRNRSLYFVEAGDRGEALLPAQLDAVFTAVDGASAGAGALVAVFVHGWHHSAGRGDAYVCRFSDVLASVEEMEVRAAGLAGRPARDVIGVYVGWPGALYPDELANSVTTFWNRLDVADRLGATDALLNRLLAGLSQRLTNASAGRRADRRSSLIVVGHSMGARAVFSALRDDLLDGRAASPGSARGPDLVLLVNPAFSAGLYRSVHARNRECEPGKAPLLLFSSEADGVTRRIYPAGQTVTYPYGSRDSAPFLEHVYTAANFAEFVTHRLTLETVSGNPPDPEGPQTILRGFERIPAGSKELYHDNPVTVYRQPQAGRPASGDVWYRLRLVDAAANPAHCQVTTGLSAVIAVDRQVLPDHGRIFTPPFVEYIVRVLNRRALESLGSR